VSDWDHAPCCQGQPHDDEQPAVCLGCDQDFPCQAEQMRAERDRLRSALETVRLCAADRYGELGGQTVEWTDLMHKLSVAAGALHFITTYADSALSGRGA
jgi:hypothetical protein